MGTTRLTPPRPCPGPGSPSRSLSSPRLLLPLLLQERRELAPSSSLLRSLLPRLLRSPLPRSLLLRSPLPRSPLLRSPLPRRLPPRRSKSLLITSTNQLKIGLFQGHHIIVNKINLNQRVL